MTILHITSGDIAGGMLENSGLAGEILVWHDILYDGPRNPGWPHEETLYNRARFLQQVTDGGLKSENILKTLRHQYSKLESAGAYDDVVLWFDACLFDQSMLAHILACMIEKELSHGELLCVSEFPDITPFHGLGQLTPEQLVSLYNDRRPVTDQQFQFAPQVDKAFATQRLSMLIELSLAPDCPLPWIPAAITRWLQERPDPKTGLGRLESLAFSAILNGCESPEEIFVSVAAADTPPQYWGDTTLWAKINGLAERQPPLVKIHGPGNRLPQWKSEVPLREYKIKALVNNS